VKKSFNIQKLCTASPKVMQPKHMHPPPLLRAFQRHQEHNLTHASSSGSHHYKTKQNKLPSFIARSFVFNVEVFFFFFSKIKLLPMKIENFLKCSRKNVLFLDIESSKLFNYLTENNYVEAAPFYHYGLSFPFFLGGGFH
jgi:hypothetical protein